MAVDAPDEQKYPASHFVDVEAIREQIFKETHEALKSGASKVSVNGTEYWMEDGVVVTLIDQRRGCRPLKWSRRK